MAVENFGYKNVWLAIRATPAAVAENLMADAVVAEWNEGTDVAYEMPNRTYGERVFLTPALGDWVLCVGTALAKFWDDDPPTYAGLAVELARRLETEVQYFATNRIVESHVWLKAGPQGVIRAFSYADGEIKVDIGAPTDAELEVREHPGEDDVMHVAGEWSVDPSQVETHFPDAPAGMLGRFVLRRSPSPADESDTSSSLPLKPWWKLW